MTPEQQARLDELREKKERGVRPPTAELETPVHMKHSHTGGTGGMAPCACPPACALCPTP
jgi:hypothetical protein